MCALPSCPCSPSLRPLAVSTGAPGTRPEAESRAWDQLTLL